jgi:hypothetical protein
MYKSNAIGNYHLHLVDCHQCLLSSQSRVWLYIVYSLPVSIGSTSRQRQLKMRKIAPHLRVIKASLQGDQPSMMRKRWTLPSTGLVSIIKVRWSHQSHPLCSYLSKSSKLEVILNLTYGKLHTFSFAVNEKLTLTQDMLDHIFPHVSQNAILYLVLSWPWEFTVCIW